MSTLYRAPPRLVVGQIFGADNLSWRFYGNVLRGNSLHESENHSGSPRDALVLLSVRKFKGNVHFFFFVFVCFFVFEVHLETFQIPIHYHSLYVSAILCSKSLITKVGQSGPVVKCVDKQFKVLVNISMCMCSLRSDYTPTPVNERSSHDMEQCPFYILSRIIKGICFVCRSEWPISDCN